MVTVFCSVIVGVIWGVYVKFDKFEIGPGLYVRLHTGRELRESDTSVQYKTSAVYFASNYAHLKYPNGLPGASYQHPEVNNQRARSVTVPNVGGFAGVMFSFTNFKASVGYRGDFFFDAMDTGFDSAKRSTIGFYGPFATVSVGFGG